MANRSLHYRNFLRIGLFALALALIFLLPKAVPSAYWMRIINLALLSVISVLGLDIAWGLCGQVSLGHAAFYGVGAYTSALLIVDYGFNFWTSLPIVVIVSLFFGLLLGVPTLRLRAQYLALATIGFQEIFYLVTKNWVAFTHGPVGIGRIPIPQLSGFQFKNDWNYYYLIIIFVLVALLAYWRIYNSRLGRAMKAIRDSQIAAECMGIPTTRVKVIAFMLSSLFAGLAGALYASLVRYIGPESFTFDLSIEFLTFDIIGGAGYIVGPVIGSFLLTFMPEWLRFMKLYATAINSLLIVLIMIFKPTGVWGIIKDLHKFSQRKFGAHSQIVSDK